jgi:GNAT superfamily N-acetyltransferase
MKGGGGSMKTEPVPQEEIDAYGLPDLPFIVHDPENTRYVTSTVQSAYLIEDSEPRGFIVYHEEEEQLVIHYLACDDTILPSQAHQFLREFCHHREVFVLTYEGNAAQKILDTMGYKREVGLQFMELDHIPHFRSHYNLDFNFITPSRIPSVLSGTYDRCFSVEDGKMTLEEFVHDPYARTGNAFMVRMNTGSVGFWIDVIYHDNMCFNCWIGILPEFRRKGYGTQCMEYALSVAQERGCTRAGLLVNPSNHAAITFYEKIGFKRRWGRVHYNK